MYQIKEYISLKGFNTFGINATARYFTELTHAEDIITFCETDYHKYTQVLFLGGGSNMLFTKDIEGCVVKLSTKGIELVRDDQDHVYLRVQAGEQWDDLVSYTVEQDLYGLENLSLIPGTVGACPVQNIGAYGTEVRDTIVSVECFMTDDKVIATFDNDQCHFGYRDSIFKNQLKGKAVIMSVVFKLNKKESFNFSYSGLKEKLGNEQPTLQSVRNTVIAIRREKLPDPTEIGNAGSFFKNPIVPETIMQEIKKNHPTLPVFNTENGMSKIAAAFLIDKCHWMGKRFGDAGVSVKHPLILVNYGNAPGSEIKMLAETIITSVKQMFGVTLEMEVNIV